MGSDLGPRTAGRKALPPSGIGAAPWIAAGAGRGPGCKARQDQPRLPEKALPLLLAALAITLAALYLSQALR